MHRIVISMSDAQQTAQFRQCLAQKRSFSVCAVESEAAASAVELCRSIDADILLLGVRNVHGFTVFDRAGIIDQMLEEFPECKIVLYADETASPQEQEEIKTLYQMRFVDDFVLTSCTSEYLIARLEALWSAKELRENVYIRNGACKPLSSAVKFMANNAAQM